MKTSELFGVYLKEAGWELMNLSFVCAQRSLWLVNGTYWKLRQSLKPVNYSTSAQVMNIHGRFKLDEYLSPAKRSDFILTHNRFVNPEYVLQDHVTLYQVNEKEALFVEAPEGYDLWRAKYSPFFMNAQYRNAQKLVIVPIHAFHRLADERGDPKNVTFFTNTARCGSTLVVQMFEETGQIVSVSEPSALNVLTKVTETKVDDAIRRLVVSTVRMLCKPTKLNEVGYVLKLTAPAMPQQRKLAEIYPKASNLFMYRDPIKVAQSIYRLSEEVPAIKSLYYFGQGSDRRLQLFLRVMGMPADELKGAVLHHHFSFGIMLSCLCQKNYKLFYDSGVNIAAIRYEDIIEDPIASMRSILQFCHLPVDRVDRCKKALEYDSQAGTPLSSTVLSRHPTLPYAGAAKEEADRVCDKFGFPYPDQEYVAPGTVTYRGQGSKGSGSKGQGSTVKHDIIL